MWRDSGDGAARSADLYAREADLALPPELRPVLARRLLRRRRADLVAYWVAIVAGGCLATWALIELTVLAVVRARPAGTALVVLWALGSVATSLLGGRPRARSHYRRRLWPAAPA
jgi:hypothetical protein